MSKTDEFLASPEYAEIIALLKAAFGGGGPADVVEDAERLRKQAIEIVDNVTPIIPGEKES